MASKISGFIQHIEEKLHSLNIPHLDVIGDVHGYAIELELLLRKMGYEHRHDIWSHHTNKAVFIGDFINRGPQSKKVLQIVRSMVEFGSAFAILGNHEINAILYFTTRKNGLPIRLPGPANKKMLDNIKREYINDEELAHDIKWLRKQPLYLDFHQVRFVHAYWNKSHIELLHGAILGGKLKRKFLKEMVKGGTAVSKAFMQTTKGVEFCFPPNLIVKDNLTVRRMYYRVKWWKKPSHSTFEEMSFETKFTLPNAEIPPHFVSEFEVYHENEPPVFVGHYCVGVNNLLLTPNICCIDACVAGGGQLAAYRWTGESQLSENKIVMVERQPMHRVTND